MTRSFHLLRIGAVTVVAVSLLVSCTELKQTKPNPYLAETQPPKLQEFRWSNGGVPKSVDPARASAAPETDVVRALYEGLAEVDPASLKEVSGVAEKWFASDDKKVWTFLLRRDAKWSNGKPLTAHDFVRSWQRLLDLGEMTAHRNLLDNISRVSTVETTRPQTEPNDFEVAPDVAAKDNETLTKDETESPTVQADQSPEAKPLKETAKLDVTAQDDHTLIVKLEQPDAEFPSVVVHPIFRPIFGVGNRSIEPKPDSKLVSNGAFKIHRFGANSLVLERSETYWNAQNVTPDRVEFIPFTKTDDALENYRNGKVDAVTNADFAPLAQKVFSPYADFQKSAFAALNFYEINHTKPPFNDRRIREALSISIEREKLSEAELEGTTQPAFSFLPFPSASQVKLVQDKEHARELFEQAGFAGGRGFPVIRLVVNRNETQQRVAREVMRMWKDALNVETLLVVKENNEIAETRATLDFDILRRGIVYPVTSEFVCISSVHSTDSISDVEADRDSMYGPSTTPSVDRPGNTSALNSKGEIQMLRPSIPLDPVRTEEAAIFEMQAIPLYFPMSFALVKPYVSGFEMNNLDAQSLAGVSIESNWQPR